MILAGDNPIRLPEEDVLGRAAVAYSFAREVALLDRTEGVVVGVLGAWGSGKTSFINLARNEFGRVGTPILDFNPWMFSGAEQLVESFFIELAAQLKLRPEFGDIGRILEDYGEAVSGMGWLPLVGPWIERARGAAKILGRLIQRRKEGVGGRREKLRAALADLHEPIVVVVDDIDRLSTSEIRDVFKLVRLTASFPNIIYVVAFDRARVEGALSEQGVLGRDYLEKILHLTVDLPAIPDQVLISQVLSAIDGALSDIADPGPFDQHVWPDVFMEIIWPLIRNMRDVRRFATAIHWSVGALGGRIALADLLALEAVRVFLPGVFERLYGAIDGLTTTGDTTSRGRDDSHPHKEIIEGMIKAAEGNHGAAVRGMIERLFPAAQRHIGGSTYGPEWKKTWLKDRRVAHEDILKLYLERVAGESLEAFADAERTWTHLADRDELEDFLHSIDMTRLQDVIASLEVFEDSFEQRHVVPGAIVLLNLLPSLPERKRSMFEFDTRMVVTRVVLRLLRCLDSQGSVETAVRQILPEVNSLSSRLEVLNIIGYRDNAGHKLVSEKAAIEFESAWRSDVRSASADDLSKERNLLWLLHQARYDADASESSLDIEDSPALTLAILQSARSDSLGQSMGSRALHRSPRLSWDALIKLYDDEATLRKRIKELKALQPDNVEDLLELAENYLSGWRPED